MYLHMPEVNKCCTQLFLFRLQLISYEITWSVHSFNGDYLSIPKCKGSCGYLFMKSCSFGCVQRDRYIVSVNTKQTPFMNTMK